MKPNARQLSRRDPAAAILLGAMAAQGSDFGSESNVHFGTEFGSDDPWGHDPGYNFGFDHYGVETQFGNVPVAVPKPTPQAMMSAWNRQVAQAVANKKREVLLEPNKGADAKVERYAFPISQEIVIGTPESLALIGNPTVHIRPQRVTMNSPCVGFALVTLIQVANVVVTVGPGSQDSFDYSPLAVGTSLDLPTLTPANAARVNGTYSGLVPPGYTNGFTTQFCATFLGWASIVA